MTEDGRQKGEIMAEKSKYWVGVLYPENMIDCWQEEIGDVLELAYAYCIHDKDTDDVDDERKVHVHLIVAFPNTTTYKHAFSVFSKLNASGRVAVNCIEQVINIRQKYEYLIHNTDTCKKKRKHLYDIKERVTGNNFDIGSFEQISIAEKNAMLKELCDVIVQQNFTNFIDFYMYVVSNYDTNYFEVLKGYSGFLERLTKGNYQKVQVMASVSRNV